MHKLPLKKAIALSVTAVIAFAIAVACFFVAPLLDGLVNGSGSLLFSAFDSIISAFNNCIAFLSYREIIVVSVSGVSVVLILFYLIMIIVRKQPKHLIPFFIALISIAGSIVIAAAYVCGSAEETYLLDWLIAQLMNNVYYGAIILSVVAVILAALVVLFIYALYIVEIVDLCRFDKTAVFVEKKKEEVQRSSEPDKEAPSKASNVSNEEIRKIIHEECEMLYIKLLKYRLIDVNKEEKVMLKDEERRARESAEDEDYYSRMISELGMFNQGRKPAPATKPAPAPQPAPVARPVVKPAPAPVAKPKIIRIPFETRIATVDKTMKDHFNELKSDILAYGVKSRVSNSGDTFRLHTVTYVKITIAGKSLKLYLALDPKDYKDTTLPIADVSHKGIYKEIPLVFKVKSELSLRRAKQLIADAMAKGGLEQGPVEAHDWVNDIVEGK